MVLTGVKKQSSVVKKIMQFKKWSQLQASNETLPTLLSFYVVIPWLSLIFLSILFSVGFSWPSQFWLPALLVCLL